MHQENKDDPGPYPKKALKETCAVFVCESQPPNIAEVIGVLQKIDAYDKMIVCISGNEKVTPLNQARAIWKIILQKYRQKIYICSYTTPFHSITVLPELFLGHTILTIDKKIFVHLSSLGIDAFLLPRVSGYEEIFLRAAYRQSKAYEFLNANINKIRNKEEK